MFQYVDARALEAVRNFQRVPDAEFALVIQTGLAATFVIVTPPITAQLPEFRAGGVDVSVLVFLIADALVGIA